MCSVKQVTLISTGQKYHVIIVVSSYLTHWQHSEISVGKCVR